jgi:hypothetical protein
MLNLYIVRGIRLNRKYEKLVESANDSNAEADNDSNAIGPLEATIRNLQKEVMLNLNCMCITHKHRTSRIITFMLVVLLK